ncbi:LIM domain protein [Ancylostoma caninum]|uniref:LIM domain protein n=1 Tax=Ancylostoma caninum TaxID=29170 RepID=A0A368FWB1_ANCCA|nr:LIM domain protein [Ancylostoma caninum]
MGIMPPCACHAWSHLRENTKFDYIEKIVHYIRTDNKRLKNAMVTLRPHVVQKRKNQKPLTSSNPKRCGSIQRLADNLMGCSSFAAPGTMAVENDEDSKYYTKRPPVDRLNPELVQKVERIVSGDLTKQRESELYAEKTRKAERLTQRLPKNDIEEMEKKLEHSGMGVLYAKKEHISSQDEKIIRANAAYARKEVESGFSNEEKLSRFKASFEFDSKIAKSEEVMRRRDLAGVDPFEKWRLSNPYPYAMPENDVPKSSVPPPPPPRKAKEVAQQNDGVIMRPIAPVQPKRHMSAPVMPSLYDSVNARRQETCRLCEKVVYLAERMQVESMFVHKNCFRCAYCNQPLRLGEYGKDKDLEFRYPRRFFCKTHLRAPLKEKIARIERAVRLLEKSSSRDQELLAEIAQVDESPIAEAPDVTPTSVDPLMQCSATLSFFSPEQLRDRTVQRMRDCGVGGPISPISEVASVDERTPERAEFSSQLRKSSLPSADSKKPELELSGSNSSFEEDEFDECDAYSSCSLGSNGDAGRTSDDRLSGSGEESSASEGEEDALEEGDLEELEKTVLQFSDENPERPLTDAQVCKKHFLAS